jgi:hypothetical protein
MGGRIKHNPGASRRGIAEAYLKFARRHCEKRSDEAIHSFFLCAAKWIASLRSQ